MHNTNHDDTDFLTAALGLLLLGIVLGVGASDVISHLLRLLGG